MANYRNCIHQGFAYAVNGYKDVHIVCDLTGDIFKKSIIENANTINHGNLVT